MTEIPKQTAFPNKRRYNEERRPVRKIPTQQQLIAAARRQAAYEVDIQEADPSYSGHFAGIHPEHRPRSTDEQNSRTREHVTFDAEDDYELEEAEEYYVTRPHSSVRRYQDMPIDTRVGRIKVEEHYHEQPLRAHRHQLPPPRQRERYTDEVEQIHVTPYRRIHPLVWIGIFGILLVAGWTGLNVVSSWYLGVQNDWTYGQQRHFEINAVVGHGDSQTNPSHFTAENNNGQIIVIELPGNNVSKVKIYQIETVPGNTGNPPVKLSFQDMNADGKPDMLVQIGDGSAILYVTLFNNGSEFVSKL